MNKCLTCEKETTNPKFCSKSCAAKSNNTLSPKRKLEGTCKHCGNQITATRSYCKSCFNSVKLVNQQDSRTYGQLVGRRNYQKHSQIRELARRIYNKSDKPKQCSNCGYDKHFEICHIKALKEFSDDSLLKEINSLTNLIALCPNCHWEFDSGLLKL